jgi:hypothetical protein
MNEPDQDLPDDIDEPEVEVIDEEPAVETSKSDALASSSSAISRRDPLAV